MSRLRISLLLVAAMVIHDAWMATAGHEAQAALAALAAPSGLEESAHGGAHHHPAATPEEPGRDTSDVREHCGPLRVAAPLNRDMTPALDTAPVGVMPESTCLTRFAAASRTFIEMPPPHPPDLNRAFFQVYLI